MIQSSLDQGPTAGTKNEPVVSLLARALNSLPRFSRRRFLATSGAATAGIVLALQPKNLSAQSASDANQGSGSDPVSFQTEIGLEGVVKWDWSPTNAEMLDAVQPIAQAGALAGPVDVGPIEPKFTGYEVNGIWLGRAIPADSWLASSQPHCQGLLTLEPPNKPWISREAELKVARALRAEGSYSIYMLFPEYLLLDIPQPPDDLLTLTAKFEPSTPNYSGAGASLTMPTPIPVVANVEASSGRNDQASKIWISSISKAVVSAKGPEPVPGEARLADLSPSITCEVALRAQVRFRVVQEGIVRFLDVPAPEVYKTEITVSTLEDEQDFTAQFTTAFKDKLFSYPVESLPPVSTAWQFSGAHFSMVVGPRSSHSYVACRHSLAPQYEVGKDRNWSGEEAHQIKIVDGESFLHHLIWGGTQSNMLALYAAVAASVPGRDGSDDAGKAFNMMKRLMQKFVERCGAGIFYATVQATAQESAGMLRDPALNVLNPEAGVSAALDALVGGTDGESVNFGFSGTDILPIELGKTWTDEIYLELSINSGAAQNRKLTAGGAGFNHVDSPPNVSEKICAGSALEYVHGSFEMEFSVKIKFQLMTKVSSGYIQKQIDGLPPTVEQELVLIIPSTRLTKAKVGIRPQPRPDD